MFWDTTKYPAEYPQKIKKIYFKESITNRKPFTKWIGKISKNFPNDIDWWVTIPLSRDPYLSNLYHYICILKTLKVSKRKIKIDTIIVNSKSLLNLIKIWLYKNKIDTKVKYVGENEKIKNFFILFKSTFFYFFLFFIINIFTKKKIIKKDERKSVLIDTFATKESIYGERLYQGLDSFIKTKKIKHVFFVPTFIIEKNLFKIVKIIHTLNKKNYLFKEHYLKINDIFFASCHFLRIKKYTKKYISYYGWDLSKIICEEITSLKNYPSKISGILNYRFAKNIFFQKIYLKKVINWFENQIVDKGWNLGFRKYSKNTETYGYQGFLNYPHYMHSIPAKHEEQARVIPSKIFTIGKAYKNLKKEFFPKINISVGPALNYQKIFKINFKAKKIKVLAILSGIKSLDLKILEWISSIQKMNKNLKIVLKPHPILPLDKIVEANKNLIISNEKLSKLLIKTEIAICTGPTSATIESLAYNCDLLVPIIDAFDEYSLKILNISKKKYTLIHNKIDLAKLIKKKLNKKYTGKTKKSNNLKLRNFLFEKLNNKNIKLYY